MARDADSDKPSKRRWGRGEKPEEGPTDDELGWLADLRGARDRRAPLAADDPTGTMPARGRRGTPPDPPPADPPRAAAGPPAAPPRATEPRRRGASTRDKAPPPSPAPGPPASPPPPLAGTGAAQRSWLRRTPPAPAQVPPVAPAPTVRGPAGVRPPDADSGWFDLTGEVPKIRDEPPPRPAESRARPATRRGAPPPTAPPLGGLPLGGPPLGGPPLGGPPLGGPPMGGLPLGGPPMGGPKLDPLVTTGMIKRAEIRKHLRIAQQLKVATLIVVAILLLAAYPIYEFTRAVTQDPVFGDLDALDLPSWATIQQDDAASGSRWCIGQCRLRERTWASERKPEETQAAYDTAFRNGGWRPRVSGVCPAVQDGMATCWQRDEYVMDVWVREPICDLPPPRPTASAKPAASASAAAGADPTQQVCPGSLVTVYVYNAIDYHPVS